MILTLKLPSYMTSPAESGKLDSYNFLQTLHCLFYTEVSETGARMRFAKGPRFSEKDWYYLQAQTDAVSLS